MGDQTGSQLDQVEAQLARGKPFSRADALAWEVALEIEAANADDSTFGILALNWKKAYDGVSLQTQSQSLTKAGVPHWARLPLLGL